jgi:hypothetical protein
MKCSACGYENNEEAKFCNACGNKLEEVKSEPQKPVDNPTPIVDPAPPKPVTGDVAKRKFSTPVIIGIAAIILLIVSAGAFAVPAITVNTISGNYPDADTGALPRVRNCSRPSSVSRSCPEPGRCNLYEICYLAEYRHTRLGD